MAYDFSELKRHVAETEEWLTRELSGIRTGRASPALLDAIKPEAYGVRTPLSQLGAIAVEGPRTLRIVPWDASLAKTIEKSIVEANLGVGVASDNEGVRVSFPELTAERRSDLAKLAGAKAEEAKTALRGHRTKALHALDAAQEEGGIGEDEVARIKGEIQKIVDAGNAALAVLLEKKKAEIAQ